MGATVTCGKFAAAFEVDGKKTYVLFERTYEKNCYPHDPTWGPAAIGDFESVMEWVFGGAASCEGRMLQSTHGHIIPENYIAGWVRELNAPAAMPDFEVNLHVAKSESEWRAPINADNDKDTWCRNLQKTPVLDRLRAAGLADLADVLDVGGSINRPLYAMADILTVVYPHGGIWRCIPERVMPSLQSVRHPELGPVPRKGPLTCADWKVWRLNKNDHLVIRGDGSTLIAWPYSIVGQFITSVAFAQEMSCTGSAKPSISAFRAQVDMAPMLPDSTRVTIRRSAEADKYHVEYVDDIARALGLVGAGDRAPAVFTTNIGALRNIEVMQNSGNSRGIYWLSGVRWQDVEWALPIDTPAAAPAELLAA
jgi:hypothetical protein